MVAKHDNAKVSMKAQEYIDKEILHLTNKIDIKSELNKIALEKAETRMDDRLEGMNEFREQLNFQSTTFVKKETIDIILNTQNEKIDSNFKTLDGRISANSKLVYIGLGIVIAIQFIAFLLIRFVVT